jgi:uncharacterized membrane protein
MESLTEWLDGLFRWAHVVAGVLWIGLLYFFNWVNGPMQAKLDAETKKKVVPELMPRALYFFRWGAAYTWVTGIVLAAIVYYHGKKMVSPENAAHGMTALAFGLGSIFVAPFVYDALWKALQKKEEMGVLVSFALLVGLMGAYRYVGHFESRALFIHVGAVLGTTMAFNVWFRIWPSQQKIIKAVRDGQAPDPALPALAGLRSKHNTYMSVPLVFTMVSNHFPATFLSALEELSWALLAGVVVVGWTVTKLVYKKAASPAPTQLEPKAG